jgi:hypothetical protein
MEVRSGGAPYDLSYTFDAAGNRSTRTTHGSDYTLVSDGPNEEEPAALVKKMLEPPPAPRDRV